MTSLRTLACSLCLLVVATAAAAPQPAPPAPEEFGLDQDIATLTFFNSSGDRAVVRFGKKEMLLVAVGDRLGKNKAVVKAITPERLELEESFTASDGKPNRAQIVLKKGETGGTRYLLRPDGD
jgi:Tfp pilus assembly protein PilP